MMLKKRYHHPLFHLCGHDLPYRLVMDQFGDVNGSRGAAEPQATWGHLKADNVEICIFTNE